MSVRRVAAQQPAASKPRDAVVSFFNKTTDKLSGAVSLPIAGPLAAWVPPTTLHGWIHGVSRER
ncbi:hypothetical protein BJD12_05705 [Xanthomonas vesicatoria ATCC 35937]|nr:hypothetical protein BI313_08320 [Xanthomonas vesicatoria]APP74835.1 hypothetical protein BJD12_05705 [Xanthomonas vesicatoria ATCC 35937]